MVTKRSRNVLASVCIGGVTYGTGGEVIFGPLAGNFDVPSFREPIFGATLRYAVSPTWRLELFGAGGQFQNQFDTDPEFTNDYFLALCAA